MPYEVKGITDKGRNLLSKAVQDGDALVGERVDLGSTALPTNTNISSLLQVPDVKLSAQMNTTYNNAAQIIMAAVVANDTVTQAFDVYTIGFFAHLKSDPATSVLVAVIATRVTPDSMPKYDAANPIKLTFQTSITYSQAANVTAQYNPSALALNENVAHKTNDETWDGTKSFLKFPKVTSNSGALLDVVLYSNGAISLDGGTTFFTPADDSKVAHNSDITYSQLPSGTDLFNLINNTGKTKYYCIVTNATTATLINCPVSVVFTLEVKTASPKNQANGSTGNPQYVYNMLELHPYNSNDIWTAAISSDKDGNIVSTPWSKQINQKDNPVYTDGSGNISTDGKKSYFSPVDSVDTVLWQKNKITSDDGSAILKIPESFDVNTSLLSITGLEAVAIAYNAKNNPSGLFMQGTVYQDPSGQRLNGIFSDTSGTVWVVNAGGGNITTSSWYKVANDSKVVHQADMRVPSNSVVSQNELTVGLSAKADAAATTAGLNSKVIDNKNGTITANGKMFTPADDSKVVHNSGYQNIGTDDSGLVIGNDQDFGIIKRNGYKAGIVVGSQNSVKFYQTTDSTLGIGNNNSQYKLLFEFRTDGKISINAGTPFVPADDSTVTHTSDTSNWQKTKISNDDGSVTQSASSSDDTNAKILAAPAGLTSWYIQVGATNNPESDSLRGYIYKDPSGFGSGTLYANNGNAWRVLVVNGNTVNWRRIPLLSGDNAINNNVYDVLLTKYGIGVADPVNEYWNSFRNRLKWESRAYCPKGTDWPSFVKSSAVQSGLSIARDDNTGLNWHIIKENSSDWIFGFAVGGSGALTTFTVESGNYSQSNSRSLNSIINSIDSKPTILDSDGTIGNYPDVVRQSLTGTPNLNSVKTNGLYAFAGIHFTNGPDTLNSGAQYGYLKVMNAGGVIFQDIYATVSGVYQHYKRCYSGAPAKWYTWVVDSINPAS